MSLSKKLLLVLIPSLVVLVGLLCVLLFLPSGGNNNVYLEKISSAKKMVEQGNYQDAIVFYENAIEEDEKQEEPYIGLADIYVTHLNDINSALNILNRGYDATQSTRIKELLDYYKNLGLDGGASAEKPMTTEQIGFNTTALNIFAANNYAKYSESYTVTGENLSGGVYTVKYQQYDAVFEYANSPDSEVINPDTNKPYDYARPTAIRLNTLDYLISGTDAGVTIDRFKSLGAENIAVSAYNEPLGTYLLTFDFDSLHITLGCDENGTVKGKDSYNVLVPKPGDAQTKKVKVEGDIIDVTTGQNVSTADVSFHKGKNSPNGEIAAQVQAPGGKYSTELDTGDYTVEISADGYNTETFDLYVSDAGPDNDKFSISPTIGGDEIRIVLEWGAAPSDLDSHLDGTCDGTSVRIDFMNRSCSKNGQPIADLDVDDQDGFGPETITIHKTNGSYEYKVHRYFGSGTLAASGATVKIYQGSGSPTIVNVPTDLSGDWWEVCSIENGEVKLK